MKDLQKTFHKKKFDPSLFQENQAKQGDKNKWGFVLGNLGNLRAAVTAERHNLDHAGVKDSSLLPVFDKSQQDRELIRMALLDNFFFRRLNKEQIEKLIDAMTKDGLQSE